MESAIAYGKTSPLDVILRLLFRRNCFQLAAHVVQEETGCVFAGSAKEFEKGRTTEPKRSRSVDFTVTPEDLSLIDVNFNPVVEPGTFELMVGANSAETTSIPLEVVNQ